MSLIRCLLLAVLTTSTAACVTPPAPGQAEVCPARSQPLRTVEIFDGKPEDLALLMPDEAGERAGHWTLGYIYVAGRTPTVRCNYGDGQRTEVLLSRRVARCDYRLGDGNALLVTCR
jgi:hypothetical protein